MAKLIPLRANWQTLVEYSEQMLNAAHTGDWQYLAVIEAQRNPLIREYFLAVLNQLDSEERTRQLTWLQAIELELLELCSGKKDKLSVELQGLKRGKTAGDAYLSNAT